MYVQEVSLQIDSSEDKNKLCEEFDMLMSYYRGSGQAQGKIESSFISGDKITGYPYTLEKDSLNIRYNNFYVNRQIKKIEDLSGAKLQFKTVGKSYHSYVGPCSCKKSDYYILITNYISISSPVDCGNCNQPVPLYRLPVYHDYGYMPILSWESNYISCDTLQMNCEVGEIWAMKQMWDAHSQLSKQGREICRRIEELTNTPTYYYLFNYRRIRHKKDLERKCPVCNGEWILPQQLHNLFDFKCDKCRLVSSLSSNSSN